MSKLVRLWVRQSVVRSHDTAKMGQADWAYPLPTARAPGHLDERAPVIEQNGRYDGGRPEYQEEFEIALNNQASRNS